jgi:hypothetical protein
MCQHNIQGASRSSSKEGIWNLNFDAPHVSEIPFGFGFGKVLKLQRGVI